MANYKKFTSDDIKSGFVVELRDGRRLIATRAGGGNFTRILVDPSGGGWEYTSMWNRDTLDFKNGVRSTDIMKVYGLVHSTSEYSAAFRTDNCEYRTLLWERREPVKMTLKQIEEKLGHAVQIVSGE